MKPASPSYKTNASPLSPDNPMSLDLSVNYGGLFLHSPIVVGACPMTMDDQTRLSLESAGAGAIVLPSIFEEQVSNWIDDERDDRCFFREQRRRMFVDSIDAKTYLALVNRSSNQLMIPVIASINGGASECCVEYASELQEAGAAGIEINLQPGHDREFFGSGEIEDSLVEAMEAFSQSISVPLFVKFDRGGVSLPHLARRCCSGVSGMVLHGRSPDVDICLDNLGLCTQWNLSPPQTSNQLIEPIMRLHLQCPAMSIAASGGISTCEGVAKVLLAGADVAMLTSELYRSGPDIVRTMIDGLIVFLQRHHLESMQDLQRNRPVMFDDVETRTSYVSALSHKLPANHQGFANLETSDRETGYQQCDRWGHLLSESGQTVGQSTQSFESPENLK
ncbi:dihydroorotate dehydrogenase [Rubripirellula obstinata]|nr:dihydroorotate dehydrogenase [Rubripirellula obstinata]